jgi:hypothetical protein
VFMMGLAARGLRHSSANGVGNRYAIRDGDMPSGMAAGWAAVGL